VLIEDIDEIKAFKKFSNMARMADLKFRAAELFSSRGSWLLLFYA
jgi:hypothetical protein